MQTLILRLPSSIGCQAVSEDGVLFLWGQPYELRNMLRLRRTVWFTALLACTGLCARTTQPHPTLQTHHGRFGSP